VPDWLVLGMDLEGHQAPDAYQSLGDAHRPVAYAPQNHPQR